MKIVIPIKSIKEALVNLSKVVLSRPGLTILGAVKVDSSKEGVTISATNLEESLSWNIRDFEGGGSFIINFKELKDYLKQGGSSGTVQFEDVGERIAGIFHAGPTPIIRQFETYPFEDWPKFSESRSKGNEIRQKTLECIQKAIPSAAEKKDCRSHLKGVLLEPDGIVATSGKELVKFNCMTGVKESIILPSTKFIKSANFAKNDASIYVEENDVVRYCTIKTDQWAYTTKCVQGNYPNYNQVIPKSHSTSLEISEKDIEKLQIEIQALQGDEEHNTVHLYADGKILKILSENMQGKDLDLKGIFKGSGKVAISLNRNLLLRALDLGFRRFYFQKDGFSPVLAKDHTGLFVFMPLRSENSEKIKDAVAGKLKKEIGRVNRNNKVQESNKKEKITMPEETKHKRTVFKVVEGTEQDPFEELLSSINETKAKAKEVYDMAGSLSKKVKNVQRAQKAKEREFKHTRELLGKLKKVSGF